MKKILSLLVSVGVALSLLVGCSTINNLTPSQIATIGTVITQVADQGAVYAIHQDKNSVAYFKLAVPVLDNFANGTDLSPTALQSALSGISGTNQWVRLAITAAVVAYDASYSQYISGQLTNSPAAKAWIIAVDNGFKEALNQGTPNLTMVKVIVAPETPDFIVDGAVSEYVIKARVRGQVK